MNLNPVSIGMPIEGESASANVRPVKPTSAPTPAISSQADLGTEPKREAQPSPTGTQAADFSRDEVQVQRDSQSNDAIVIRYVDSSGNLILQVPSSQVLGLARAIEQALQDQASERAAELAQSQGGKSRGH